MCCLWQIGIFQSSSWPGLDTKKLTNPKGCLKPKHTENILSDRYLHLSKMQSWIFWRWPGLQVPGPCSDPRQDIIHAQLGGWCLCASLEQPARSGIVPMPGPRSDLREPEDSQQPQRVSGYIHWHSSYLFDAHCAHLTEYERKTITSSNMNLVKMVRAMNKDFQNIPAERDPYSGVGCKVLK